MEYHNQGRSYEGDWRLGHWHGEGKSKNSFGDTYKGEYHNDLKHGDGRLEYADGRVFEGYFKADDAIKGSKSNSFFGTTLFESKVLTPLQR